MMKTSIAIICFVLILSGCANICEFGESAGSSGMKCYGMMERAKPGMTQKDVQQKIGYPDKRQFDIHYMGKVYDEVWIYDKTPPSTVLYFDRGILQKKDYQQ